MGTLNESPIWTPGVRYFDANAPLTGGPDCPDNLPLQDLANRTAYLKQQDDAHAAANDPHPQYMTTAESDAAIAAAVAALVNSSPAALDTLAEFAAALGNDPNFAATITNLLATKAPLDSPALVTPTATTPAQFDATTRVATMDAVKRALGSFSGTVNISSATALTNAAFGKLYFLTQIAGSYDTTLPPIQGIPNGESITFINASGLLQTIKGAGTDTVVVGANPLAASYTFSSGEYVVATVYDGIWEIHGSGTMKSSASFASSLGQNGWKRYPDPNSPTGYITEQWFLIDASVAATGTTPFPVQFPNTVLNVSLTGRSSPGVPAAPYLTSQPSNSAISWDRNSGGSSYIYARAWGY